METSEFLYLVSIAFGLLVAFLFFRYLYWGVKARLTYWKKIPNLSIEQVQVDAREKGMQLPYFSILVPARDEADVIALTIDHLATLNYPKDRYEVVIITDGKELRTKRHEPGKITTQDVVEEKIKEFAARQNVPALKHAVVPYDFDGRVGGVCLGREVTSTKARALNYGLGYIDKGTTICSFYDAESRPEQDALLYVAARYVATGGRQKLWQGPVFQVRNFYQLGPMNKIIALYQALAHEWYYPILMQHLPFLGGTNLHVERDLLIKIGGYDPKVLSEDLELGVRAYLETGEWPEYLPVVSTEQTPARYKAYFRQRLRWGSGHLQVFDKLQGAVQYSDEIRLPLLKTLFWKGHAQWYFYQALVVAPLVFLVLALQGQLDPSIIPKQVKLVLGWMAPIYYSFTFYLFYRYRSYINFAVAPKGIGKYLAVLQLCVLPIVGFFIALPFTTALVLRAMNRQPQVWVKTPRTQEMRAKAS
ncbi:glycosyltransferase [Zhaonella formicivorans]|uniref:glycosyltransferase n=1 Tax=Zhaonella formicivorans TaxID=2528593 RepID=UPI0010F2299F|nr:glycosyltransferase family 2 protein [Zhaonella formicivorans]